MTTAQFLGWRVLDGIPRCQRKTPYIQEVIIRAGYFTKRGNKEIYIRPVTENKVSDKIFNICDFRMVMDESWKPSPEMDSWLTKWVCNRCGAIEYINRAVLPLCCGGKRE
jgi:hypothetical protein